MNERIWNDERSRIFGKPGQVSKVNYSTPWGDKVSVHSLVLGPFMHACYDAANESDWRPQRIDSYNPRPIRGTSSPSLHGWALAWDFFATPEGQPPPGGVWHPANTVPDDFAACFIRQGFTWGRYFSRQDWPHIEWARGKPIPPDDSGPLYGPSVTRKLSEVEGVLISQHEKTVPSLDEHGTGWVELDAPMDRLVEIETQGPNPPVDGYWSHVRHSVQPHGNTTIVTLYGQPHQATVVYYKVLEA